MIDGDASQAAPPEERARPSEAAQRALQEARARRRCDPQPRQAEINGRGGLDPVRYGDWEVKGLASDY